MKTMLIAFTTFLLLFMCTAYSGDSSITDNKTVSNFSDELIEAESARTG